MADLSRQLGRVTYDGKFAAGSIATLGDEALAVGRDLGDELPLGQALAEIGVKAEDTETVLGRITAQAEKLGTVGGPAALRDTIAAAAVLLVPLPTRSTASFFSVVHLA